MFKINNSFVFNFFLALLLLTTCTGFVITLFFIIGVISHDYSLLILLLTKGGILIFPVIIISLIIDEYIQPEYYDIKFSNRKLEIVYYKINRDYGFYFLSLFFYKKHLSSTMLLADKYEFYGLSEDKLKLKKILYIYGEKENILSKFMLNISFISKKNKLKLFTHLNNYGFITKNVTSTLN